VLFHHLASRSPWRTRKDMQIPERAGLVAMVIESLPRVGPYRLGEGVRALSAARAATRRALDAPIDRARVTAWA
jgi:hypothetical protein